MTPETIERMEQAKDRMLAALQLEMGRGELKAPEILALLAYLTGSAIAYQDQTKMHPSMAMAIVMENIKRGNAAAVEGLRNAQPGGLMC